MNNVGEFFFSSPINPTDLSKDWGRSDNDQRHRLVLNGSIHSSLEPAEGIWQHLTHGFQFGPCCRRTRRRRSTSHLV